MKRIPIDRGTRTTILSIFIILFLVVWGVGRTVMSLGIFNSFPEQFAGSCKIITGMKGPEDLDVDWQDKLIFVSATNRRAPATSPDPQDGLYTLNLNNTSAPPVKLAGTPKDFRPHGISLYRAPEGGLTLFAINHRASGKQTIEVFDVKIENGKAVLSHRSVLQDSHLIAPNDLFAFGPDQFYVGNDHTSTTALGRWLEDYLQVPRANLLYYNGSLFKVAVENLNFTNGVLVSPDGKFLYLTSTTKRALLTFERNPFSGELTQKESLDIPARLDNLSMDAEGNLWTTGHPKFPGWVGYDTDPSKPSPSVVFKITLAGGIPQGYETVYANNGEQLAASSSVVAYRNHLFIGSVLDNKMLDCTRK
jgi:arylesterase/paraoxonase